MKIAVVGAAGLLGRHVTQAAIAAGHDVLALARALPDGRAFDLAEDLSGLLASLRGVDVVVWAAARASVEGCEANPTATRVVNVDAVRAVFQALPACTGLLAFSSEYVFDGHAAPVRGYLEGDARRALNASGQQKIELENLVTARSNSAVLRVSALFGEEPGRKNFVLQLVDASRAGRRLVVANDQWVTPTFALDLGSVVVDLARQVLAGSFGGVLHAAGPEVLRRDVFARQVVEELGLRPDVIEAKPTSELGLHAQRPLRAGLDTSLLHQVTGAVLRSPREALHLLKDTP